MQVELELAPPILQSAVAQVQTPWGQGWALVLALTLLIVGIFPWRYQQLHWWAFSGAVLSTIFGRRLVLASCCRRVNSIASINKKSI